MAKKILIVEDDDVTRTLLQDRLTSEGFDVVAAADGAQALKKAQEFLPEKIIMDLMLPDMPGEEIVVRLIEELPEDLGASYVFLSGILSNQGGEEQQVRVKDVFYPALGKPVDFEKLIGLLNHDNE